AVLVHLGVVLAYRVARGARCGLGMTRLVNWSCDNRDRTVDSAWVPQKVATSNGRLVCGPANDVARSARFTAYPGWAHRPMTCLRPILRNCSLAEASCSVPSGVMSSAVAFRTSWRRPRVLGRNWKRAVNLLPLFFLDAILGRHLRADPALRPERRPSAQGDGECRRRHGADRHRSSAPLRQQRLRPDGGRG